MSSLPPLVLGLGDHGSKIPADRSLALIDQFVEAGGRAFDTAHIYAAWIKGGEGASERALGHWLRHSGMRDRVTVVTKGAHPLLADWKSRINRDAVRQDISESLDRLGIDRVDLWLFHRDDPAVPVAEIVGWAAELQSDGLASAVGCSNWTVERIEAANAEARRQGVPGLAVNQILWNLAVPRPGWQMAPGVVAMTDEIMAWHRRTGFPTMAFQAQARGFFAGKYALPEDGRESDPHCVRCYGVPENERRLRALREIAARTGYSPNQIALAWLWHQGFPAWAVAAPQNEIQMRDTCGALGVRLAKDDLRLIGG